MRKRWLALSCCVALLSVLGAAGEDAVIPEPAPHPPAPPLPPDPVAANIKAGRTSFLNKQYAAALEKFTLALAIQPSHREARFLAGLAAYWARRPDQALEHWTILLDSAPRKSDEEWKLENHRVLALSALNQLDAAEQVAARIAELRKLTPAGLKATGFVREHFYTGNARIGCWEVFDDKGDAPELWTLPVTAFRLPDEPVVARLAVAAAALPGGGPGFVLTEEGAGYTRVYKRWSQKPPYSEVRPLILQILENRLPPLEEKAADNAAKFPGVKPAGGTGGATAGLPSSAAPPAAPAGPRVFSAAELGLAAKVVAMGLAPEPTQILTVAARLCDVQFDVTRLTRLSLTDKGLAERHLQDLNARAPYAQEDAAELVDLISRSKPEHVRAACDKLARLGPRQPYLDYALLTAFNTRSRDVPLGLLRDSLKSGDFIVRQTAALLLGRAGDKRGLTQLFKEVEQADALGGAVLQGSIEELLGPILGSPPPAKSAEPGAGLAPEQAEALAAWRKKAAAWWRENEAALKFANGQWTSGTPKRE
jgi:tetratricopeptide (TPR) repeat protein